MKLAPTGAVVVVALLACKAHDKPAPASTPAPTAKPMAFELRRGRTDEPVRSGVAFWPDGSDKPIALPEGTSIKRMPASAPTLKPSALAKWNAPLVRITSGEHNGESGYVVEADIFVAKRR